MSQALKIQLHAATRDDFPFIVEMARHACIIEDWTLPDADSDEVHDLLPAVGEVPIVALDAAGSQVGAVWTFHADPPLRVDSDGVTLPELCIAVVPDMRDRGVGGVLLDALFTRCGGTMTALVANVHVRNPARTLYQRNGFEVVGRGRGALGIAMQKDF